MRGKRLWAFLRHFQLTGHTLQCMQQDDLEYHVVLRNKPPSSKQSFSFSWRLGRDAKHWLDWKFDWLEVGIPLLQRSPSARTTLEIAHISRDPKRHRRVLVETKEARAINLKVQSSACRQSGLDCPMPDKASNNISDVNLSITSNQWFQPINKLPFNFNVLTEQDTHRKIYQGLLKRLIRLLISVSRVHQLNS